MLHILGDYQTYSIENRQKYSAVKIIECLNRIEFIHEYENIYRLGYKSELSVALGKVFNIDFSKNGYLSTKSSKFLLTLRSNRSSTYLFLTNTAFSLVSKGVTAVFTLCNCKTQD